MSTLTSYNGLQVVTPSPSGAGGLAINNNFKALATNIATSNPTTSDDSTMGYSKGSRWYNSSTTIEWVCTDATAGAAVWIAMASGAYLPLAGGTMTGELVVDVAESSPTDLVVARLTKTAPGAGGSIILRLDTQGSGGTGDFEVNNADGAPFRYGTSGDVNIVNNATSPYDSQANINFVTGGAVRMYLSGGANAGIFTTFGQFVVDISEATGTNLIAGHFAKNAVGSGGSIMIRLDTLGGGGLADFEVNSGGGGPWRYGTYLDANIVNNATSPSAWQANINFVTGGTVGMSLAGGSNPGNLTVAASVTTPTAILTPGGAPGSPTEGQMYYDSSSHHLYVWNGSAWKQCDN